MPNLNNMFKSPKRNKSPAKKPVRKIAPRTKPARKIAPKSKPVRKIAPKSKPARKIAPRVQKPASPVFSLLGSPVQNGRASPTFSLLGSPPKNGGASPAFSLASLGNIGNEPLATPDRKFANKYWGENSGERDKRGRNIYIGSRGGRYVISSIGKRVPYVHDKVKAKANKDELHPTGQVDKKGQKIYRGKKGGLFVIDSSSGKKKNPLRPFRNA